MSLNACKKGKRGEVEFCQFLNDEFGIKTERNYNQAGGKKADIIVNDFIFEVKRREEIDLDDWWYQVCMAKQAHDNDDLIPVVAFRKNKQDWEFLLPATLIGCERGYMRVPSRVFIEYARGLIK